MNKLSKIKAVIIDDEVNNCNYLSSLLNEYCPKISIEGTAHNASSGIQLINEIKPRLVFLDIKMPGGSGFDMLKAIPHRDFEVIFVTAFDQYAIKAIRFCAFDYLLKPINLLELQEAVARVSDKIMDAHNGINEKWQMLEANQKGEDKSIALPSQERVLFVKTKEITRCQGESNYTFVFLSNGEKVLVSRTLKDFEELLNDEGFIRVHQSHLVNKHHVKSFEKGDGGYLKMLNNDSVPVSRMRKENVLKTLSSK